VAHERIADGGTPYKVEGCDILTIRDGKMAAKRSYRKGARPQLLLVPPITIASGGPAG
jgi:hypothetical protein